MSRIDEALRRAATEPPAATAAGQPARRRAAEPGQFPREATEFWSESEASDGSASEPESPTATLEIGDRTEPAGSAVQMPAPTRAPSPSAPPASAASTVATESVFDHIHEALAEKVVADVRIASLPREQYRRLAAVLHDSRVNRGASVLMVASAMPAEGKTLTATNLALTLSESYQDRVLLIDADLRRPALHDVFKLSAGTGLLEGLAGNGETKLVVRQVTPRLAVLPAGRPTSDPMAALTSPRMKQLLAEARETFDWVILDTPPLMLLPDAHLLSGLVDGAVLVVRANSTAHDAVRRAADIIGRERISGVVLNCAQASDQAIYGAHSYYDYGPGHGEPAR